MQIGRGIAHPVRMVDAQAVHRPVVEPSQHEVVRVEEDPLDLDAQADQGVHVEEAPVAEVARRRLPEGDAVVLPVEQLVHQVRVRVDALDLGFQRRGYLRALAAEPLQRQAQHFLVAMPAADGEDVGGGGRSQAPLRVRDEGQLVRAAALRRRRQQGVDRARRHRPLVVVIADGEGAVLPPPTRTPRFVSTRPYWSSSTGSITVLRSLASGGSQSTSKYAA
jgi:hypothetical protein